jgi:DNA-binding transcriptional regulator YdaS (Cro superfamily)
MTKQERDQRLLSFVAEFLYGPQWQSELARALKCDPRTVRSWVQGRYRIVPETWVAIERLLDKKLKHTDVVRKAIKGKIRKLKLNKELFV